MRTRNACLLGNVPRDTDAVSSACLLSYGHAKENNTASASVSKKTETLARLTLLPLPDTEEKTTDPRVVDEDKSFILNITEVNTKEKPICNMEIGGVPVTMYADSGSPFTIVNEDVWNKSFVEKIGKQLTPPDIQPKSYTGEKIPVRF
ncbi:hypothetical protein NDU88_004842 [Pleurodeles waltl]|uniref:Uncharacterized protein n=1 Tax=Pleurodeles waltl TaxID=8319 RepID=A0AAV7MW34_PLEWA|nr:hypothetical protein NDU88_004842 [Pleurodeles waltl]